MSLGGSPLGISSAVQAVLAYPKTAVTIAACCAAFATFMSGGPRSEILSDPVCIEASCPLEEPLPMSTQLPVLPPMEVKNSCPVKPVIVESAPKKKVKGKHTVKKRDPNAPVRPRKPKAPVQLDDCGNPINT